MGVYGIPYFQKWNLTMIIDGSQKYVPCFIFYMCTLFITIISMDFSNLSTSFTRMMRIKDYVGNPFYISDTSSDTSSGIIREDVYLTDLDSDTGSESEIKQVPSPIKVTNVNVWESRCCINVSPIISSDTDDNKWKMEPMTVPTMSFMSRKRIENVFREFN